MNFRISLKTYEKRSWLKFWDYIEFLDKLGSIAILILNLPMHAHSVFPFYKDPLFYKDPFPFYKDPYIRRLCIFQCTSVASPWSNLLFLVFYSLRWFCKLSSFLNFSFGLVVYRNITKFYLCESLIWPHWWTYYF